ncbi:MAG: glycosyltransferase [Gammaproteobacteria bacterium]|nr:glycosyltransferase [Gammaproteobacteria bacterium]
MTLTVIVPAFNEEAYLGPTLDSVRAAADHLCTRSDADVQIIVVDNGSEDRTASVARSGGAVVVHEPVRSIARARNAGARHAIGEVLVFVDADVTVPRTLLHTVHGTMRDSACVGGGVDVDYRPRRLLVRLYLHGWRLVGRLTGMVQGATQFCRRDIFEQAGGYDERAWMGEDVDFYWTLKRLAKREHHTVRFLRSPRVQPSCRRFEKWPLWRILLWTNPLFIVLFRRRKAVWKGWYSDAVR